MLDVQRLANQRKAVGVDAGGGEGDQNVARRDGVDLSKIFDLSTTPTVEARRGRTRPPGKSRAFPRSRRPPARSPPERSPSATPETIAAIFLRHVLSAGDVVQEEERLRAAADYVVDAHGHAVDAHGIVLVQ